MEDREYYFRLGYTLYKLWSTHGLPIEIARDILIEEAGSEVWNKDYEDTIMDGFEWARKDHKEASKNKKLPKSALDKL